MKKIIPIISILFLFACAGNRSVEKSSNKEKNLEKRLLMNSYESKVLKSIDSGIDQKIQKNTDYLYKTTMTDSFKETSEENSRKNEGSQSYKAFRNTEYYENGNKKSETEYSEELSKIINERNSYKNVAESLKNSYDQLQIKTFEKEKLIYKQILQIDENRSKLEKNQILIEKLKKSNSKNTDRDFSSYAWYAVTFILGILFCYVTKLVLKKVFNSQSYLIFLNKIRNGI